MAKTTELKKFFDEYDDAKKHFLYYYKPEFDRAYKQFAQYTGDRAEQLEKTTEGEVWQSNAYWGQVFAYIKLFLQKTVGVSPDFNLSGKNAEPLKELLEWLWEVGMSDDLVDHFLQTFICGTSLGKDILKKQVKKKRKKGVLEEKQDSVLGSMVKGLKNVFKKLVVDTGIKSITFRPDFEPVDMYNAYPHVRMKKLSDNLPLFQRYVLTLDEMKSQYPNVRESFWNQFIDKDGNVNGGGDTTDYAWVRKEVLLEARRGMRDTKASSPITGGDTGMPQDQPQVKEKLFEVVERWVDDRLVAFLPMSGSPKEIKDIDNPYDHSEKPYKRIVFFPRPFQFYGYGLVKLVEKLQDLLNTVTNQRVDAVTVKVHGMIAAAPVALPGYKQSSITIRPLGILWTNDPNSVKELRFGDVNSSAYLEVDKIKEMMRVIVGIDDYSTLKGTDRKETATVASFMREATLEGVKLFLIQLRNAYTGHFDHWISMIKQFWTKRSVVPKKALAILDDHSDVDFPVLEESWMDENGEHMLFNDEYEMSIEAASTLATSTELKKQKDMELWELVKDSPELLDEETGQVYTIKKFKILMKLIEDFGWEAENYVVPRKIQPEPDNPLQDPVARAAGSSPGEVPVSTESPLPGREIGGKLGSAVKQ